MAFFMRLGFPPQDISANKSLDAKFNHRPYIHTSLENRG